ncbi:hypothetical protein [Streptomyces sp. NBC_00239]|uniref:hypothetical protein n=1 Tax=Streptomyces sp. NBC_00239 TaxID=2903640 RepID=UPI002E2D826B|nr:hypothetical protein [Streptomyces sp. NBC_00239]
MHPTSPAGPVAGTPAYWSMLERQADSYSRSRASSAPGDWADAQDLMMRLKPYGTSGLLDLSTLLVLHAIDRCPVELRDGQGRPALSNLIHGQSDALTTIDATASANARLNRGPETANDLADTEQQIERINDLETAVATALQTRAGHPKARRNVRRALTDRGEGAREASAIFGILSEIMETIGHRTAHTAG